MGFLNKLIQIYLTGISPEVQVFTISQKVVFKKREQGERRERKQFPSNPKGSGELSTEQTWASSAEKMRGAQRPEGKKPKHCVQLSLVSSSFQSPAPFFTWTGALNGSVTSFQSHGFLEGKVQARSILNSPRESSASMQADQRENKILPPPREEQLDISPIPSPAYDLEVHLDLPQTAHSARGGSLQGGPFLQMLASEP